MPPHLLSARNPCACSLLVSGCAHKKQRQEHPPAASAAQRSGVLPVRRQPPAPGTTETGIASWYGHPYHGRRAADGEIYDMETLVAAHRTLPFNTWVTGIRPR